MDLAAVRGKTVLLVEDNAVNAFISAASLESMGVASVHASNGNEAVNFYRERRFDAILMDCEMPVMDGFETCRRMRAHPAARPWLVAVTGWGAEDDRRRSREAGFDAHLLKPAMPAQVAAILARTSANAAGRG